MRRLTGFVLAGVAYVAAYALVPHHGVGYDLWWQLFSLVAVGGVLIGVARNRPAAPSAWLAIGAGLAMWVGGDATYLVSDWQHWAIPYPGVDDALYLCGYPLIAAGLVLMIRRSTPGRDWSSLIDAGIVGTSAAVVAWVFLIELNTRDVTQSLAQKAVSIAYPTMDLLFLALLARMVFMAGHRSRSYYWLVAAIVFQLIGDILYSSGQLYGFYTNGGPLDLPLAGAYLCFAVAAWHPSMVALTQPTADPERRLTRRRLAVLAVCSAAAPAMLAIPSVRAHPAAWPVAVGGGIVLFALVIARLAGIVGRYERAVAREEVLREAASRLVAASGREAIYEVACWAAPRLAEGDCAVEVLVGQSEDASIAPVNGTLAPSDAGVAEIPLMVRGLQQGLVRVRGQAALVAASREAAETLAAQVGLALESTLLAEELLERQSEQRFRSLVQSSSDLIAVLEPDLTIRSTTPSVESVLGYGEEELVGHHMSELLSPTSARTRSRSSTACRPAREARSTETFACDGGTAPGATQSASRRIWPATPTSAATCSPLAT